MNEKHKQTIIALYNKMKSGVDESEKQRCIRLLGKAIDGHWHSLGYWKNKCHDNLEFILII